jgi:hypothetical protein
MATHLTRKTVARVGLTGFESAHLYETDTILKLVGASSLTRREGQEQPARDGNPGARNSCRRTQSANLDGSSVILRLSTMAPFCDDERWRQGTSTDYQRASSHVAVRAPYRTPGHKVVVRRRRDDIRDALRARRREIWLVLAIITRGVNALDVLRLRNAR